MWSQEQALPSGSRWRGDFIRAASKGRGGPGLSPKGAGGFQKAGPQLLPPSTSDPDGTQVIPGANPSGSPNIGIRLGETWGASFSRQAPETPSPSPGVFPGLRDGKVEDRTRKSARAWASFRSGPAPSSPSIRLVGDTALWRENLSLDTASPNGGGLTPASISIDCIGVQMGSQSRGPVLRVPLGSAVQ